MANSSYFKEIKVGTIPHRLHIRLEFIKLSNGANQLESMLLPQIIEQSVFINSGSGNSEKIGSFIKANVSKLSKIRERVLKLRSNNKFSDIKNAYNSRVHLLTGSNFKINEGILSSDTLIPCIRLKTNNLLL